jgi:predicted secreted hydrolase
MNRTIAAGILSILLLLAMAWSAFRLAGPGEPAETRATLSPAEALAGADTVGYARAVVVREFVFPDDHLPHPGYRTEWWYLTGHLKEAGEGGGAVVRGEDAREFAFQVTFFRSALAPVAPDRASRWNTNQLWMGHFGFTDVAGDRHWSGERLARGGGGLAGASAPGEPFLIRVEDWEMAAPDPDLFPLRVRATEGDVALDLTVERGKPPVFQGRDGLSQKGPEPGNASYYYSYTHLPVSGTVTVEGRAFRVRGEGWMDREWSTSALGEDHVGWDWFSLQLSDGREIMFFELRRTDGARESLNHGALVAPDGSWDVLKADDVEIEVLERWRSPVDGASYPSGWRIRIPERGVNLRVVPRVRDQEMNLTFRYWEGAVTVEGTGVDGPVRGLGFVEMTGYGEGDESPEGGGRTGSRGGS